MTYQNITELKTILREHQLSANKKLGQNFLISMHVIDKIIAASNIKENDHILEIGPGLGVLTARLLDQKANVTALELDPKIYAYLKKSFTSKPHLNLINQDALKFQPTQAEYKVVANIPYYITSPLITHFLANEKPPQLMVLLTQKEVAQKICSKPGEHSVISLQTQLYGTPKLLHTVKNTAFNPVPKVDSAILKIQTHPKPLTKKASETLSLIKTAFTQKRKKLSNSLSKIVSTEQFEKANIDPNARPQHLKLEQWIELAEITC